MAESSGPRIRLPTQLVLHAMLSKSASGVYGLELCHAVGLTSGTIHPILARLKVLGSLESRWEDCDPRATGRPRRCYYRLTPSGIELTQSALRRVRTPVTRSPYLQAQLVAGAIS
jgi:DNA-binding transcriptional regulator PaaX